ncbi:hypothetical protein [Cupriavidus sp. AcVe19-6a]|uniref:hypothetical protein n=1 Tax=Cupriavidus sp. AcVe19-6a TaxID=2821358 RepID=UPI001AE796E2|nr:hypothetical protein [Cupriavidus sp. AcVe19-6a]MBP0634880.1 hypothetical protein [Cupriavidus sp. AcVe19-6a]
MPDEPIDARYIEMMNVLASVLADQLQPSGFALLVFDCEDPGRVNYISNCSRQDMIAAMQEFLARNEGRLHDPRSA